MDHGHGSVMNEVMRREGNKKTWVARERRVCGIERSGNRGIRRLAHCLLLLSFFFSVLA